MNDEHPKWKMLEHVGFALTVVGLCGISLATFIRPEFISWCAFVTMAGLVFVRIVDTQRKIIWRRLRAQNKEAKYRIAHQVPCPVPN